MAVKTNGAQFKRFYSDESFWGDETYHDETDIYIDGQLSDNDFNPDNISDTSEVKIEGGYVMSAMHGPEEQSMEAYFKRWLKIQNCTVLCVECNIADLDAIKAAIKAAGGRIL